MKSYEKPTIEKLDLQMEGVYAGSGDTETPPTDWNSEVVWTNHNGGSHSDVQINLTKTGGPTAKSFDIDLNSTFQIGSISHLSGPGTMTLTHDNNNIHIHVADWTINGTQNGSISFQIIDKNSKYGGSHYESGTHLFERASEFTVVKCESR